MTNARSEVKSRIGAIFDSLKRNTTMRDACGRHEGRFVLLMAIAGGWRVEGDGQRPMLPSAPAKDLDLCPVVRHPRAKDLDPAYVHNKTNRVTRIHC